MSLTLRPMQPEEFADYSDYFVPDYAAEIARNFDLTEAAALAQATAELASDLPQGAQTARHDLFCIDAGGILLGYLWCQANAETRAVFVFDFCILPAHRGRGHGKAALDALSAYYGAQGMAEIKLRVAADNQRAQRLYLNSGFKITGFNMQKPIQPRVQR